MDDDDDLLPVVAKAEAEEAAEEAWFQENGEVMLLLPLLPKLLPNPPKAELVLLKLLVLAKSILASLDMLLVGLKLLYTPSMSSSDVIETILANGEF